MACTSDIVCKSFIIAKKQQHHQNYFQVYSISSFAIIVGSTVICTSFVQAQYRSSTPQGRGRSQDASWNVSKLSQNEKLNFVNRQYQESSSNAKALHCCTLPYLAPRQTGEIYSQFRHRHQCNGAPRPPTNHEHSLSLEGHRQTSCHGRYRSFLSYPGFIWYKCRCRIPNIAAEFCASSDEKYTIDANKMNDQQPEEVIHSMNQIIKTLSMIYMTMLKLLCLMRRTTTCLEFM